MCDYCELGKTIKKQLIEFGHQNDFILTEFADLEINEVKELEGMRNKFIDYSFDDEEIVAIQLERFVNIKLNNLKSVEK